MSDHFWCHACSEAKTKRISIGITFCRLMVWKQGPIQTFLPLCRPGSLTCGQLYFTEASHHLLGLDKLPTLGLTWLWACYPLSSVKHLSAHHQFKIAIEGDWRKFGLSVLLSQQKYWFLVTTFWIFQFKTLRALSRPLLSSHQFRFIWCRYWMLNHCNG